MWMCLDMHDDGRQIEFLLGEILTASVLREARRFFFFGKINSCSFKGFSPLQNQQFQPATATWPAWNKLHVLT